MDEIASDVGMAKPSLYYYYPTKESLFLAVIAEEEQRFTSHVDAMLQRRIPASQKLKEYAGLRLMLFRELMNLSQLGFDSWLELKGAARDRFRTLEQQETAFIEQILAEGKASGEWTPLHPRQTALVFLHILHGLRLRMLRSAPPPVPDESAYAELRKETELAIDYFIHGIRIHQKGPS